MYLSAETSQAVLHQPVDSFGPHWVAVLAAVGAHSPLSHPLSSRRFSSTFEGKIHDKRGRRMGGGCRLLGATTRGGRQLPGGISERLVDAEIKARWSGHLVCAARHVRWSGTIYGEWGRPPWLAG
jgi:hypothetical protein